MLLRMQFAFCFNIKPSNPVLILTHYFIGAVSFRCYVSLLAPWNSKGQGLTTTCVWRKGYNHFKTTKVFLTENTTLQYRRPPKRGQLSWIAETSWMQTVSNYDRNMSKGRAFSLGEVLVYQLSHTVPVYVADDDAQMSFRSQKLTNILEYSLIYLQYDYRTLIG